jgi:hypothetical protein
MKTEELKQYAELLISMSTDYLSDGITDETFSNNIRMIGEKFAPKWALVPIHNDPSTGKPMPCFWVSRDGEVAWEQPKDLSQ